MDYLMRLSDKQKQAAEMLTSLKMRGLDRTEISKELGVSRRTLYNWTQNDQFAKYVRDLHRQELSRHRRDVLASLLDQCKKGNVAAQRLFFELEGSLEETKRNVTPMDKLQIVITNSSVSVSQTPEQVKDSLHGIDYIDIEGQEVQDADYDETIRDQDHQQSPGGLFNLLG